MPNPGQPTISPGATGEAVPRLQRALRGTPNLGLVVDGVLGPATENAVKEFIAAKSFCGDGNRKRGVVLRACLFRQGISRRGVAASKVCVV
jgi:peptidoglycan hydrolase-like protein with peptidoglycan-binding domain